MTRLLPRLCSACVIAVVLILGSGVFAHATVLCVSASGSIPQDQAANAGCSPTIYTQIGTAVAASAPYGTVLVFNGSYSEMVIIPASLTGLSLVTAKGQQAIIDASGFANGILDQASFVTIRGFQIENALHEGILVEGPAATCNAGHCSPSAPQITHVSIIDNSVHDNDKSLNPTTATCAGSPDFEQEDCGEGVHLDGVAYSVASNNTVENNSGGFLLTDETNSNHDNVISANDVHDNPFDCGLTIPSHPPNGSNANIGVTSFGVFDNTIAGNLSEHNGDAGTGVFTPTPGTASYQQLIINNRLIDNGQPGVSIHEHAPGQTLKNLSIIGNFIQGNGAEPEPGPGETNGPADPTGIEVYADLAAQPITGVKIIGNNIADETNDIWVGAPNWNNCGGLSTPCYIVAAHLNDFESGSVGVNNTGSTADVLVNASLNFWGCDGGPGSPGCATAQGNVIFEPFLPFPLDLNHAAAR